MDGACAGFVYWYLCGSDLESNYGAATADLNEMMQVKLPENVKVVIQTGGASKWQNDQVKTDRIQRYEYSGDTLTLKDETEQASMGDPERDSSIMQRKTIRQTIRCCCSGIMVVEV